MVTSDGHQGKERAQKPDRRVVARASCLRTGGDSLSAVWICREAMESMRVVLKGKVRRPMASRRTRLALALMMAGWLSGCASEAPQEGGTDTGAPLQQRSLAKVRNVILMINDGAGWGAWDAAAYWQHGSRAGLPQAAFVHRYGMSTHPLNTATVPTHDEVSRVGYDPVRAWDLTPVDDERLPFAAYRYLNAEAVDSAAAATALASGIKTYNQAVNVDNHGRPVDFITQVARRLGKATGVVTSVPFAHATPAAFGAQNPSRRAHREIGRQMLNEGMLDLIIGTGAPGFNVNGTPCGQLQADESRKGCRAEDAYLDPADWERLSQGRLVPAGAARPWQVVRSRPDFEALARGERRVDAPLFGSPEVADSGTLQQGREASILGEDAATPSGVAFIRSVPTLQTLTLAALRHLARDPDGFFLMVEGGATDWAAHASRCDSSWRHGACHDTQVALARLIEESIDFNDAVAAVVAWVEKHSSWNETLLIVTADHDNSMPMGPDAQTVPFQPVENRGRGRMPGISFRPTGEHSNALVPLWAMGAGAEGFERRIRGRDAGFARHVTLIGNDGSYVDNTDVFVVMRAALTGERVPALSR